MSIIKWGISTRFALEEKTSIFWRKKMAIQTSSRNNNINMSRCHIFPWMTAGSPHSQSFFKLTGRTDSSWTRCHSPLPTRNQNCSTTQTLPKISTEVRDRIERFGKSGAQSVSRQMYTPSNSSHSDWQILCTFFVIPILIATDQFNILLLGLIS